MWQGNNQYGSSGFVGPASNSGNPPSLLSGLATSYSSYPQATLSQQPTFGSLNSGVGTPQHPRFGNADSYVQTPVMNMQTSMYGQPQRPLAQPLSQNTPRRHTGRDNEPRARLNPQPRQSPPQSSNTVTDDNLTQGHIRTFTGRVTRKLNLYGFIDDEVFFQDSACVGDRKPHDGDEVQVTAEYNPSLPMKWTAKSVVVSRTKADLEEQDRWRQEREKIKEENAKREEIAQRALKELESLRQKQAIADAATAKYRAENERLHRELTQKDAMFKQQESRLKQALKEQQELRQQHQNEMRQQREQMEQAQQTANSLRQHAETARAQAHMLAQQRDENASQLARMNAQQIHKQSLEAQAQADLAAAAMKRASQAEQNCTEHIAQLFAQEAQDAAQTPNAVDVVRKMVTSAVQQSAHQQTPLLGSAPVNSSHATLFGPTPLVNNLGPRPLLSLPDHFESVASSQPLLGDAPVGFNEANDIDPLTMQLQHQALVEEIMTDARKQRLGNNFELEEAQQQLLACLVDGAPPYTRLGRHLIERMYERFGGQPSDFNRNQFENIEAPQYSTALFGPPLQRRGERGGRSEYDSRNTARSGDSFRGNARNSRDPVPSSSNRRGGSSSSRGGSNRFGGNDRQPSRYPVVKSSNKADRVSSMPSRGMGVKRHFESRGKNDHGPEGGMPSTKRPPLKNKRKSPTRERKEHHRDM